MTSEEARYREAKLNMASLYPKSFYEGINEEEYLEKLRKEYDESVDLTDDSVPMGKDLI